MTSNEKTQYDTRGTVTRRDFLKLLGAAGVALTFAPFVPCGQYMPNPSNIVSTKIKVVLPDDSKLD